jgi:hypothetical protein
MLVVRDYDADPEDLFEGQEVKTDEIGGVYVQTIYPV